MVWGTPGYTERLTGASGTSWALTFERRLAPRAGHAENPASSVWLVRAGDGHTLAAKRQSCTRSEVDSLVDEAAAWRKSSLDCPVLAELVDVFVERTEPCSVTFLHEFCARGHLPKRPPSQPVLLTLIADIADAAATVLRNTGAPHANITYDTVLVDAEGRVRVIGFGAQRSAKLIAGSAPPSPDCDLVDIARFLYNLVLGRPLRNTPASDTLPYDAEVAALVGELLDAAGTGMRVEDAVARARELGAELRAPVVDISEQASARDEFADSFSDKSSIAPDVERAVEKLTTGVDAGGAYSAVMAALERDGERASKALYKALYNCPIAKDPLCAMRALTLLHNAMLDGPPALLDATRTNDKFLDWIESTWSQDAVRTILSDGASGESPHHACNSFKDGELAFYTALLRRKARFHMLAAGGFSGAWERTGKTADDGRDVLVVRRRKVVGGMADLAEMASEIGVRFASANDEETALKHASLRAIVDECCRAANAAHGLASDTKSIRDAEKLVPGFARLWTAATALLAAVKNIRSAGAEDWADQFADEAPPDIVKEAEFRIRGVGPPEVAEDMPKDGWEKAEEIIGDAGTEEAKSKKKSKKKKKQSDNEPDTANADEAAAADAQEITAADGAMVLHGAGDAEAAAVRTMFGDLLKLDGGDTSELRDEVDPRAAQAPGELTDGQALAEAFGAPMPEEGGAAYDDYDDEGDGGYDDFRARQEEAKAAASTGAWAARAGYGGGAMVVHQEVDMAPGQRPAFFHSVQYGFEETRKAAEEAERKRHEEYRRRSSGAYDDDYDDAGSYQSVEYAIDDPEEDKANIPTTLPKDKMLLPKKLRLGDKVGEGSFGTVYKGEYKRQPVAIKKLTRKVAADPRVRAEFANEVLVMCALQHDAVLSCIAADITSAKELVLVTEYMKRGTLHDVLHRARVKLTWALVRKVALAVALGMQHCHERGIVHRDIKPANILVDQAYNAKIADFGLAAPPRVTPDQGVAGTYQYLAPEVLQGQPHSFKSDVYAFGITLCEMIGGQMPFYGMQPQDVAQHVLEGNARPPLPPHCNRQYAHIIHACWNALPEGRPDFNLVVQKIQEIK